GCPGPSGISGGDPPCPWRHPQAVANCPGSPCPLRGENVTAALRGRGVGVWVGADRRPVFVLSDGVEEPSPVAIAEARRLTHLNQGRYLAAANAMATGDG